MIITNNIMERDFSLFAYLFILGEDYITDLIFFIHTWIVGVVILLLVIATAFLGYVLPWGQISF